MNLSTFYEQKALTYSMSKAREKRLTELLPKNMKDIKILDVGCSTGYFGSKLKMRGAKVFGIDISRTAIKVASQILDQAKVIDINSKKIPCPKNTFDIIIASEIIEHLINSDHALKEFYRVLKSDGILIISTPNFLYWGNRLKFLRGQFKYEQSGHYDVGHIHFYTYSSLINDLKQRNFVVIKENHIFPGNNLLDAFKKYFPSIFAYQIIFKIKKGLANKTFNE